MTGAPKENVGGTERALRAAIGPALVARGWVALGFARHKSGPLALMLTGALVSETAVTKVCPVSAVSGVDTAR